MDGFSSYHNNGTIREHDSNKLTQIGSSIQKISQNVSSIQRMVQQLGTPQDSRELRQQLEQIQQYTQQLAKDTSANLKELQTLSTGSLSTTEQRQFKMQRERLADEFGTALGAFQATQRSAAQKVQQQIQRSKALVAANADPFIPAPKRSGDHQLIELQNSSGLNSRHQQQQQLQDDDNLRLLEEQEQSIRRLEADISDVNQIFKELGAIVHEQGDMIDSIESNVERTDVRVSEGTQWLRDASNYKNKIRRKKLILLIIAILVLAVIIAIIAWQLSLCF